MRMRMRMGWRSCFGHGFGLKVEALGLGRGMERARW